MSDESMVILLLVVWAVGLFLTLGAIFAAAEETGKKPDGSLVLLSIIWPFTWIVAIGYGLSKR